MKDTIMISMRLNRKVKEEAEKIFSSLGLTLTAGVNLYLSQVVMQMSKLNSQQKEKLNLIKIEETGSEEKCLQQRIKRKELFIKQAEDMCLSLRPV